MTTKDTRPSWDQYFLDMCELVATRATCNRKHVGAVLVRDKRVISTGYNGSLPGQPHCDDPESFYECTFCGESYDTSTIHWCCTLNTHIELLPKHGGHDMEDGHCCRTVHAEVNTIAEAARQGIATLGTTLYCNTRPCWPCFKVIVAAGIIEVVYRDEYRIEQPDRVGNTAALLKDFKLRQVK